MATTSSARTAILGVLLALPFPLLISAFLFEIEPNFGPLQRFVNTPIEGPNVVGTAIMLGAMIFCRWLVFISTPDPFGSTNALEMVSWSAGTFDPLDSYLDPGHHFCRGDRY